MQRCVVLCSASFLCVLLLSRDLMHVFSSLLFCSVLFCSMSSVLQVINLRSIRPLDRATIIDSVKKTNRYARSGAVLCCVLCDA